MTFAFSSVFILLQWTQEKRMGKATLLLRTLLFENICLLRSGQNYPKSNILHTAGLTKAIGFMPGIL